MKYVYGKQVALHQCNPLQQFYSNSIVVPDTKINSNEKYQQIKKGTRKLRSKTEISTIFSYFWFDRITQTVLETRNSPIVFSVFSTFEILMSTLNWTLETSKQTKQRGKPKPNTISTKTGSNFLFVYCLYHCKLIDYIR